MTGLEILDQVAFGQTLFHRDRDAWDLLDGDGFVAAVLCPRARHLSSSRPKTRVPPAVAGRRIPCGEKVKWKITADQIAAGAEIVQRLAVGGGTEDMSAHLR